MRGEVSCICRKLYPSPSECPPLPAHALAAQIDWHEIARVADAVVQRGAERLRTSEATGGCQITCCRALHLRRAILEHHLESLPLDSGGVWDAVAELMVRCDS